MAPVKRPRMAVVKAQYHLSYLAERFLADRMLAVLGKAGAVSIEFAVAAKVLRELLNHHIREKENNIWSDVKDNFSDEQREQMNRDFEAAKEKVKIP